MESREQGQASDDAVGRAAHSRLNRRLLTWFLLLSLVPLLTTNLVGYSRSEGIIERLVLRDVSAIADARARLIAERVERHLLLLDAIAAGNDRLAGSLLRGAGLAVAPSGAERQAADEFLRQKLATLRAFVALYVVTRDGLIVASAGDASEPIVRAPTGMGQSVMTVLERTPAGIRPQLLLAVPMAKDGEHVVAFLAAKATIADARELLRVPAQIGGTMETALVDADGRPLLVSHSDRPIDYTVSLRGPLAQSPGGTSARYVSAGGTEVFGSVASVPRMPWRFIVELPVKDALGDLRRMRLLYLLFELLFVVLLVAVAGAVARRVVAPLGRLVTAARRVEHGDLSARVAVRESDELGELENAFNEMTAALASTRERVRELHEREIERAAQLATVGELAAGVAHEIKNPVVGIASGLDLVRRRIEPRSALDPIITEMSRQLVRIQQTIEDLLTFARPAAPSLDVVSGNRIVERSTLLIHPKARGLGVRLETHLDAESPVLFADEEQIRQALVNLLVNALEATDRGGEVSITTSHTDHDFVITITDTGHGIADDDRERIFRPFFTTRHTGTGLGLPITRAIVERHNGTLTINSRPGEGTTAIVRLPLMTTRDAAPPNAVEEAVS